MAEVKAYGRAIERADRRRRLDHLLNLRASQYDSKSFEKYYKALTTDGEH